MFVFLAGMVASLKIDCFFPVAANDAIFSDAKKEVWGATRRLFIPFVAWTIVCGLVVHKGEILNYFQKVIDSPDNSLWFLLALFYCRVLFVLIRLFCVFIRKMLLKTKYNTGMWEHPVVAFFIITLCYILFCKHVPSAVGIGFLKSFFPYYVLGMFFYKYKNKISHIALVYAACVVFFCAMVPFWYRVESGPVENLLSQFVDSGMASRLFRMFVAVVGTMSFLLFVQGVMRIRISLINTILAFSGSMSLGIYALHGYFMWVPPTFLGTFAASLLMTWLIGKLPVIRFFLLGGKFFY